MQAAASQSLRPSERACVPHLVGSSGYIKEQTVCATPERVEGAVQGGMLPFCLGQKPGMPSESAHASACVGKWRCVAAPTLAVLYPPLGVYTQVMPSGSQSVQFHRSLSKNSCRAGTAGTSLMSEAHSGLPVHSRWSADTGGTCSTVQCQGCLSSPLLHLFMQKHCRKPIGSSPQVGSGLRAACLAGCAGC